mgnify:CR=1 FL=1
MSTYLYPGSLGGVDPLTHSSTTSRFVLRLIKQWDHPDLYRDLEEEAAKAADPGGWFSDVPERREGQYSIEAFKKAHEALPKTLEELIPYAKEHWESREVLRLGIDIGSGDVTREIYADALKVIEKAVGQLDDIYAI